MFSSIFFCVLFKPFIAFYDSKIFKTESNTMPNNSITIMYNYKIFFGISFATIDNSYKFAIYIEKWNFRLNLRSTKNYI